MLSQRKVDQALKAQTSIARRVYESVPIQEAWPVFNIMRDLMEKSGGAVHDHRIISGCLNDLTDTGLLKRSGRDEYRRAPVRVEVVKGPNNPEDSTPQLFAEEEPVQTAKPTLDKSPANTQFEENPVMPKAQVKTTVSIKPATKTALTKAADIIPPKPEVAAAAAPAAPVAETVTTPVTTTTAPAAPATQPKTKLDSLSILAEVAAGITGLSGQLQRMAVIVEDLAVDLEEERENVRKKQAELTKKNAELSQLRKLLNGLKLEDEAAE